MQLILRRANISRPSGSWAETDYDVGDGERDVGHIYRVDDQPESWFRGPTDRPQELSELVYWKDLFAEPPELPQGREASHRVR
jgi:hypothetical protein